jgi:protease IV
MEPKKAGNRGCLWVVLGLVGFAVIAAVALVIFFTWMIRNVEGSTSGSRNYGADEYPDMREVWSSGGGHTKVVRIPLTGMIMLGESDGFFGSMAGSAETALKSIRRATHDPEVKAIILSIDSGGGGMTASDIVYRALVRFKEEQDGRVVVAVFDDLAASGAYYVALAADHIIAHPTTITGSIGVLIQSFNMKKLGDKIGIDDVTIKSGANKDLLNPLGEVKAAQTNMLQGLVNEMYEQFVDLVAEQRDLPKDQVKAFADGSIFSATRALELGLIDQIGYWEDAEDETADLLNVDEVKVFTYEQKFSVSMLFKASQRPDPVNSLVRRMSETQFLYLWKP